MVVLPLPKKPARRMVGMGLSAVAKRARDLRGILVRGAENDVMRRNIVVRTRIRDGLIGSILWYCSLRLCSEWIS